MGHGLTATDKVFSTRQRPWHGIGTVLSDYPTRTEAQEISMPWEPVTEPLYRKVPYVRDHMHGSACPADCDQTHDMGEDLVEVEDYLLGTRSDNGETLAVNPASYPYVMNNTLWDMAEAVQGVEPGAVRYETAGTLQGGRKVWVLIALNEPLTIKGDPSESVPYLCFQNSHDRSGAFRAQATVVRTICKNTSILTDLDAKQRGTEHVFRHTKNIDQRIEEARMALYGWRESVENFKNQMELLAANRISTNQAEWFIESLIPMPSHGLVTDRVANNVTEARQALFTTLHSETNEGTGRTALGLFNAAVEYHDWCLRAHSDESRFTRNFIRSNKGGMKAHAHRLALAASSQVV